MTQGYRANLLETLEPDSSGAYIRRVVARVLGHALADGLDWAEVRTLWEQSGHDPNTWHRYRQMIRDAASG